MSEQNVLWPLASEFVPHVAVEYVDIHQVLDTSLTLAGIGNADGIQPANLLFNSPHGMGKTLLAVTLTIKIGEVYGAAVPMVVYDCSEDTREYHLKGSSVILPDGTTGFVPGPLPLAIHLANEVGVSVLCLEEINALAPGAQKQLNAITDWRKGIYVPQIGKTVRLTPGSKIIIIATMNPCFHPDTDILTPYGIKKIAELRVGDPVYSMNMETGGFEIDEVSDIWSTPCETGLIHVEGNTTDLLITSNHRVLWKKQGTSGSKTQWNLSEIGSILDRRVDLAKPYSLPEMPNEEKKTLSLKEEWCSHKTQIKKYAFDDFLQILGWYLADGSLYFSKDKTEYKVNFAKYLNTQPVRGEMEKLFEQVGLTAHSDDRQIIISDKGLYHALLYYGSAFSHTKRVLPEFLHALSTRQVRILFDAMYSCDGDSDPAHSMRYSTASEQLRNDVTWMANVLDYATSWGFDSGIHRIYISNQRRGSCPKSMTPVAYTGPVIDVSIRKNHTLVAGRNGRFNAVHNSGYGGVYSLNADLRSRFSEYSLSQPTAEQERTILTKVCPYAGANIIDKAARLGRELRGSQSPLDYQISTRDLVTLIENVTKLGGQVTVPLTFLANKYEDSDRDTAVDRIDAVFGTRLKAQR